MQIDCAAYLDGWRQGPSLELSDVPAVLEHDGAFVWLGLRMPSEDELGAVFDAFGIRGMEPKDVVALHRRPVLTLEGDTFWLILRTAEYLDSREMVALGEISVLFSDRYLITIRHGTASPLSEARAAIEEETELLAEGVLAAVTAVIGAVVDSYGPALDGLENDVIEVEAEVLSESRHRPVRRLLNLSRQVREVQLVLEALEEPLDRLVRSRRLGWTDVTQAELEPILGQVRRVTARTRTLSDLLNAAHGANLAQVSQQQNDDMRRISAWVAIAAVPTMVAGIYGMNFEHMPELEWAGSYPVVLGLIALVCGWMYRSFRRQDWL